MSYLFARKFSSPNASTRGVGGYAEDMAKATADAANKAATPTSINVAEVDMTRVRIGLGMTLLGTAALAAGVLYSPMLAVGGGLLAVAGPFVALSGLGDNFALSTIKTEGGGV